MIGKVEEFGPFINLGKGIAIPHARPEDGVNEVGDVYAGFRPSNLSAG